MTKDEHSESFGFYLFMSFELFLILGKNQRNKFACFTQFLFSCHFNFGFLKDASKIIIICVIDVHVFFNLCIVIRKKKTLKGITKTTAPI